MSRRGRAARGPAARGADHDHVEYLTVTSHDQEKHQGFHILDGVITNAKIEDATITGAKISDATISAAKFTGTIQSDNYSAGSAGWQIDRANGDAEFNDITVRGRFESGTSGGSQVVIPDGSFQIFLYTGDADEESPASIAPSVSGTGSGKQLQLTLGAGAPNLLSAGEVILWSKSRDGTTNESRVELSGDVVQVNEDFHHIGSNIAFFNGTRTAQQDVSGSRGGNAALADLLTALESYGLITDSTTS